MSFNKLRELTLDIQQKPPKSKNLPIIKTKFQGQNVEFYKLVDKFNNYLEPEVNILVRQSLLRSQKNFRVLSPVPTGNKGHNLKQGVVKRINLGVRFENGERLGRINDEKYLISGRSYQNSPRLLFN